MKTIKTQIGKFALVCMVIFSLISCTKETTDPLATPKTGSYNISKNDASGIAGLLTEAQVVDLLSDEAPVDGVYKTGRIIALDSKPKIEMQYLIDSTQLVLLSVPLINTKGNLTLGDKGTVTASDGTLLSGPAIPIAKKVDYVGHVTLLR